MNILDHYMCLSAVDLKEAARTRSPSQAAAAINMYILALWWSLGTSAKAKNLSNKKSIGTDSPALLWNLLKTY